MVDWEHKIIVVRKDGRITGSMSILLKKMPIVNSYMMYAPRGFVCNPQDKETFITEHIFITPILFICNKFS